MLTYFRKGKLQKFFAVGSSDAQELDFISAAQKLEVAKDAGREPIGEDFYKLLSQNKQAFVIATTEEAQEIKTKRGRDIGVQLLNILKVREVKAFKGYTEEDELYLRRVSELLEEGALPKSTTKRLLNRINEELAKGFNPLKLLSLLRLGIPSEFFKETLAESSAQVAGPREVILSEYLIAKTK